MTKALTDFQYQTKLNGSTMVNSLEKTHRMLARAATETGFSPESLNKLLLKFAKSTTAIGDQAKLTQVLNEFNKRVPDYSRLANIMSPQDFAKFVDRSLEKIKNTPIKLNTKENISFISKAIAKANKDYASTGFGRVAADFYKNASTAQLKELRLMRKSIETGAKIGDNRDGMLSGLVAGTAAQLGDIVMENAGFGELPGKMMTLLTAINKLRDANKNDRNESANERNAALLANSRKTEASYGEQKRVTTTSKDVLVEASLQKDELTNSLLEAFSDALSKTDLSPKIKDKYQKDLIAGKLTEGQLAKITASWKRSLGTDITPEDKKEMKDFRSNILSDISSLNEMNSAIEEATSMYNGEAKKELDALVVATKARADVDKMVFDELQGQFDRIDKELKSGALRKTPTHELDALREQLQIDVTNSVSKKYGIDITESKGMYNDHSTRVSENLSDLGIEASDELKDALAYNAKFADQLTKLSKIFTTQKIERPRLPELKTTISKSTRKTPKPITSTSSIYTEPDVLTFAGVPSVSESALVVPSSRIASPPEKKSSEAEISKRQDALSSVRASQNHSEESIKLLEKIFGQNAEKAVKVQIVNWPTSGPSQPRATSEAPSVPMSS